MNPNVLSFGILLLLAAGLIAYSLLPAARARRDAIRRRLTAHGGRAAEALKAGSGAAPRGRLVVRAAPVLKKLVLPTSAAEQTNLRQKLAGAGYRHPQAQTTFLASKTVLAILGFVLAIAGGVAGHMELVMLLGLAAFCAGTGLMLPDLWLSLATGARKEKIRYGLPDTLDLLVVSVESGLALDAALKRVGEEMAPVHPDLSEELRIATAETQVGVPRAEALDNMARRSAVDELRSLVSVITQAEKFGTSIAKALRNQAESLRTKRRQAAEERAQKTAVKLMIPLVLFIFPAMGVVLAGPAALNVMRTLKHNPALGG